ncbi:5911_t:CDS:2 [Funneliformis caledonium]|uniref:5911_t:CDS:1 n=1 Tax=Funneliformis caledonium TaxID=1117310 RepID=A0A9N9B495_9GLOM|nr:5911_t:CDS:2 [Funneliformis caledonium]
MPLCKSSSINIYNTEQVDIDDTSLKTLNNNIEQDDDNLLKTRIERNVFLK